VSIEALIKGQGYELRYVPDAVVYNRGPSTVADFLKQRRRIYAGHLRVGRQQGYRVATMGVGRIAGVLLRDWQWDWRYFVWMPAVVAMEAYGRFLGWIDCSLKRRDHAVWEIASSTKGVIQ
jgi:biofilm PGA synthesis N-glycosyltransferase PgaC